MLMKKDGTKLRTAVAATALLSTLVCAPERAHAEEVTPTAKGIVGGALLGGEVVVFTEALFGVRSKAAYLVGAGLGAAGGGVGGYFIEQSVDDGRVPVYLLAGGMALLIPAIVVGLDATRYMPAERAREDRPLTPPDPGRPGGSSVVGTEPTPAPAVQPPPAPQEAAPPTAPPSGGTSGGTNAPQASKPTSIPASLVDLTGGSLALGLPVPEVRPVLGAVERTRMGADNRGTELRFPVVRFTF